MSLLHSNNVVGMVEGLPHQTEPHGVNAREHNSSLSLRLWMPTPPLCASCSEHALAFTPAVVHQKFTSGALIEKRAYSRVVEVRDGQHRGRCAPIPYNLCQVLEGKSG